VSIGAIVFMGLTWAAVIALAGFCFGKVLFGGRGRDDEPPPGRGR
jgi:hypothetical protein